MKTRLVIVSASSRIVGPVAEAVPAIDRYDGVLMRIVRKYVREGYIDPRNVLVVSPVLGLVQGMDPVPYHEPVRGDWRRPELDRLTLEKMNHAALLFLKRLTESQRYSDVCICVGKALYPIIAGIENLLTCRIVYASGKGLGPKAASMRDWILSKTNT